MSENKLTATTRTDRGKNSMRRLRKKGEVPAVFYGSNYESVAITVNQKELEASIAHRKGLVNLEITGQGEYEVIFREVQRDPVSEHVQHVDFLGITRGQKITSKVSVVLLGTPIGVKNSGGILEFIRRQLEIECLPKDLPEKVEIDVSELEIGDSIHVRDVVLEGITFLDQPSSTITLVAAPVVSKIDLEAEEALEGEEGEEGEEGAEEDDSAESSEEK